jgi:hypothetical protein
MNIRTKEFNMSEAEFRHLIRIVYYKQVQNKIIIIMFGIITLLSIIIAILVLRYATIWFAIASVTFLSYLLAFPYITDSAKTLIKLDFQNRTCEINDNYFSTTFEDGTSIKIHFNNYIKVTRESDWYFMYSTNTRFDYLPIRAFNSEDDINEFEAALRNKKLME